MPDIAKCRNHFCPSAKTCYRYIVEANPYRQSYGGFSPIEGEDKCSHYWQAEEIEIKEYEQRISNTDI